MLALVVLDQALVFRNVWPTPWITPAPAFSVELGGALLCAALLAWRVGGLAQGLVRGLAVGFVLLTLGRYAMVTAPALYGRPVNLYWDVQHLPNVAAMVAQALPWWVSALALGGLALFVLVLYRLLLWAWREVGAALAAPLPRRTLGGLGAMMVLGFAGVSMAGAQARTPWFANPVSPEFARQMAFVVGAWTGVAEARSLPASPPLAPGLSRLAGADLLLLFFESYGAVTYDVPRYAEALRVPRDTLARALRETGFRAVTARIESPTFGGGSWFAHSSWLSGLEVRDPQTYSVLLTTDRPTWVKAFAARGYRSVGLMPGLRGEWPEGGFYGFDVLYDARRLDYRGPAFGWWRIPDQFSLAKLEASEARHRMRRPWFVVFPTITSHLPFRPVAPLQRDWQRLLTDSPYAPDAVSAAVAEDASLADLGPAYVEAIGYTLEFLADYLRQPREREIVLIVLGDHQPPALVSGEGASWSVPIHVIARGEALLRSLLAIGFQPGLDLPEQTLGPMHEVSRRVMDVL